MHSPPRVTTRTRALVRSSRSAGGASQRGATPLAAGVPVLGSVACPGSPAAVQELGSPPLEWGGRRGGMLKRVQYRGVLPIVGRHTMDRFCVRPGGVLSDRPYQRMQEHMPIVIHHRHRQDCIRQRVQSGGFEVERDGVHPSPSSQRPPDERPPPVPLGATATGAGAALAGSA